jgi:hypothetical protein
MVDTLIDASGTLISEKRENSQLTLEQLDNKIEKYENCSHFETVNLAL